MLPGRLLHARSWSLRAGSDRVGESRLRHGGVQEAGLPANDPTPYAPLSPMALVPASATRGGEVETI
jgi:hypothetical protein